MGFMDKFRDKTVTDVMDTVKEKTTNAVKTIAEDKTRAVLTILPLAVTALILFRDNSSRGEVHPPIPMRRVVNNYYYYGERSDDNADNRH